MSVLNRIVLIILFIGFSGCSLEESKQIELSDNEIEQLLIGSWYAPKAITRTGISSYTKDHKVSFIAFSDLACTIPILTSLGDWEVIDGRLIITVTESSQHAYLTPGYVITDKVISADHENMVLQAVSDNKIYSRTKVNTCKKEG